MGMLRTELPALDVGVLLVADVGSEEVVLVKVDNVLGARLACDSFCSVVKLR